MIISGTINLEGGQSQNTKAHTYANLPAFTVGLDEGRLIYVSIGIELGYWLGASDGTAAWQRLPVTTLLSTYTYTALAINAGISTTSTLAGYPTPCQKAFISKVVLTASIGAGNILVEIYNDIALTKRVYSRSFDLAALEDDVIPAFFESDVTIGTMYVVTTNNAGVNGVFDLAVTTAGVILVQPAAPPGSGSGINAGVAGQGITYDAVNSRLDVELAANPGLEITGGAPAGTLRVKVDPTGGIARAAAGVQCDATVIRTTTAQSMAGLKTFSDSGIALTPNAASGPPVAGTWGTGSVYVDINNIFWYCTAGGIPGTWEHYSGNYHKIGGSLVGVSYTGNVASGGSTNLTTVVAFSMGRRGIFRRQFLWGGPNGFGVAEVSIACRMICFTDENLYRRTQNFQSSVTIANTYTSGIVAAGSTSIAVNSTASFAVGDLIRLRAAAGITEEFARVVQILGGPNRLIVAENTVNALAANDMVMKVTEFNNLYWQNDSAVVANYEKIYFTFYNDGISNVNIGYEFMMEGLRGIAVSI